MICMMIFLAGKKRVVREDMLSRYQMQIIEDRIFSLGKSKILIPNPGNEIKCKLHYQNIKTLFEFRFAIKTIPQNIGIQTRTIFETKY